MEYLLKPSEARTSRQENLGSNWNPGLKHCHNFLSFSLGSPLFCLLTGVSQTLFLPMAGTMASSHVVHNISIRKQLTLSQLRSEESRGSILIGPAVSMGSLLSSSSMAKGREHDKHLLLGSQSWTGGVSSPDEGDASPRRKTGTGKNILIVISYRDTCPLPSLCAWHLVKSRFSSPLIS